MSIIKRKISIKNLIYIITTTLLVQIAIFIESVREHGEVYELNYRLMTDAQRFRISNYSAIYTFLMFLLMALVIYTFYNCIKFLMSFRVGKSLPVFLMFLTVTGVSFAFAFVLMRWVSIADVMLHKTGEVVVSSYLTVLPYIGMIACAYLTGKIENFSDFLDERKYKKNEKENDEKLIRLRKMMNEDF